MVNSLKIISLIAFAFFAGCTQNTEPTPPILCSVDIYEKIDKLVLAGENIDHRPDLGTNEWKNGMTFMLKKRGITDLPNSQDPLWCDTMLRVIDAKL